MFLDEFDHAIKERFGIRYYGRQMDDFFIIEESKERLQGLLRDIRTIVGGLGLELNNKTAIFPLRNGIDFLGFHAYLTDTGAVVQRLRRDSINRMGRPRRPRRHIRPPHQNRPAGRGHHWRAAPAPAQDHRLAVRPAAPPVETAAAEPTPAPAGGPHPGRQAGRDTPVGITT